MLRSKLAGPNYFFGQRLRGTWPSDGLYPLDDDARSISPLSFASRTGLPPMLLFSAANDSVVPSNQGEAFAERARRAGNDVAHLIFEGDADHGEGGLYTPAGRNAALRFLRAVGLVRSGAASRSPPDAARLVDAAQRALMIKTQPFATDPFRWWRDKRRTLRLAPMGPKMA